MIKLMRGRIISLNQANYHSIYIVFQVNLWLSDLLFYLRFFLHLSSASPEQVTLYTSYYYTLGDFFNTF